MLDRLAARAVCRRRVRLDPVEPGLTGRGLAIVPGRRPSLPAGTGPAVSR